MSPKYHQNPYVKFTKGIHSPIDIKKHSGNHYWPSLWERSLGMGFLFLILADEVPTSWDKHTSSFDDSISRWTSHWRTLMRRCRRCRDGKARGVGTEGPGQIAAKIGWRKWYLLIHDMHIVHDMDIEYVCMYMYIYLYISIYIYICTSYL